MNDVRQVLLKRLENIHQTYLDYQNNPYEPETAHQLRVNIRKLRGLLNFLKPTFPAEEYDRLNGALREAAQIYGPVRELDVLIEICGEIALEQPDFSEHFKELFDELHKERRKEMRRTFNVTSQRLVEDTLAATQTQLEELVLEEGMDWETFINKRLKKRLAKLTERYEEMDMNDYETVHKTRIGAKKVRYAADDFSSLTSKKLKNIRKQAEKIQDKLGQYTDLHVNAELLQEYAEKVEDKNLKELCLQLSELQVEHKDSVEK